MSINQGMFTSSTDDWETPQNFFDKLNQEFEFKIDVCANSENAKCNKYYDSENDGLIHEWNGSVWMNPPYGEPEQPCKKNCKKKKCVNRGYHIHKYIPGVIDWTKKAYLSSLNGATVVCLLPARTDTKWFHEYCTKGEIRFIRGRLKFGGAKWNAPFPSMVVIFKPNMKIITCNDIARGDCHNSPLCENCPAYDL